ncbi:uncharacterized protein LODBEIA_P43320 [Lodderomyces beijingensis]|uniref:AB hydrolase-1 domain-containing protein n=1 Tax=Lodderomyces beijingensis TaxID=1775926 RepID=A0ABP0ZPM3_9ASCO
MMQKRLLSISKPRADSALPINSWSGPALKRMPRSKDKQTDADVSHVKAVATASAVTTANEIFADTPAKTLYKRSTHPTSVPLSKIFSNNFPLSLPESIQHFRLRHNPLKFQHDLLATLPFYPHVDARNGRTSEVLQVPIDSKGNYINEFVIYPEGKSQADSANMKHLLMVHGYGAGLGFYLKNFEAIATRKDWCIHAIDLFGYGCSSRPHFHPQNLAQVEDWFHHSFKNWFDQKNIRKENFLVMAHSMGAYLMATYGILRDPSFCKKLLMVSPGAVIKHRNQVNVPAYFQKLWERNMSPFSIVRKAGLLGSKLVSGWSSRRFAKLDSKEAELLHTYAYGIFQARGSGEYMLNFLLAPGADARFPLVERGIHKLKCDLSWWYGEEDWMDRKGGELCSRIVNGYHKTTKSTVDIFKHSGHHIYLDNIEMFNNAVLQEMDRISIE